MRKNQLPNGWSEDRIRKAPEHYEHQPEEECLAEDNADVDSSDTLMSIPRELVPAVRELIAKHRS